MKQITTIAAALFVIVAASSCKKNKDVMPPAVPGTKLAKAEYSNSGRVETFTYNASGRLISFFNGLEYRVNYNYTSAPFAFEEMNNSNVKIGDLANTVFSSNKLISYDYRSYSNGMPNTGVPEQVQYDAEGYQIKKTYGSYIYSYTISGGNTVGYTAADNTGIRRTYTLEYYTDMPNKLNLNFFENRCLDQYLSDMEVHGKKNKNLPRKITEVSATATKVTDYTYVLDANGQVTQCTVTSATNGGTPSSYNIKFSYQ